MKRMYEIAVTFDGRLYVEAETEGEALDLAMSVPGRDLPNRASGLWEVGPVLRAEVEGQISFYGGVSRGI